MHGLPLQLGEVEVTLAVEKGWATLRPLLGTYELAQQGGGSNRGGSIGHKRAWHEVDDGDDDDDFEDDFDDDQDEGPAAGAPPPPWQDALARGSLFDFPTSPYCRDDAPEGDSGSQVPCSVDPAADAPPVEWTFPATEAERDRFLVFRDLQARGFRITGGSKFGADFLLYPGDPTLYHAQFCVRLAPPEQAIVPSLLAAACRGSFQARKHLLLASVVPLVGQQREEGGQPSRQQQVGEDERRAAEKAGGGGGEAPVAEEACGVAGLGAGSKFCVTEYGGERYRVLYMTFGPVEGFG